MKFRSQKNFFEKACKFFGDLSFLYMKATRKAVIAIDDKRILLMLNNRDEQALKETVNLYGVLCRSVARNILGSEEDAEECLDDALLTIWNAIPPAKPENYCAYLLKIVHHIALDRYKARQRGKRGGGQQASVLEELEDLLPAPDHVEQELERRELTAAITRFLQSLPQKQRDLFIRRYWSFTSFSDLAQTFDMSENHLQVTLSRLRKKLLAYLKKEGLL